jgi:hypothetical protein
MVNHVSFNEFAKIKGVSTTAVQLAFKGGRLKNSVITDPKYKKPRLDPVLAMQEWELNTRHDRRFTGNDVRVRQRVELPYIKPDMARPPEPGTPEHGEVISMLEATRRKEVANAQMAELKLAAEQGKYVEAEDVKADAFKLARTVRDSMLNIPDRVSAEFAGIQNAAEIHMRLTDEIRKALESLQDDKAILQTD